MNILPGGYRKIHYADDGYCCETVQEISGKFFLRSNFPPSPQNNFEDFQKKEVSKPGDYDKVVAGLATNVNYPSGFEWAIDGTEYIL